MDNLVVAEVFGLVLAVVLCGLAAFGPRPGQVKNALQRLGSHNDDLGHELFSRRRVVEQGRLQQAVLQRLNLTQLLERNMWQAGLYMRASEMMLLVVVLFGTGEVIGAAIFNDPLLALGAGLGMASLPIMYIRFRRKRRLRFFAEQLPYALDLIKSLLEAGHSLLRGFQVVVKEFRDPIAGEFATVLEQATLGLPLSRALEEMLKRVPEDDLRLLVIAVKVQAEVGSSLAQIIGRLADIMRNRQRLRQQVAALTAQSRMSGIIVGLLPVGVLGAFSIIQPNYASSLFYDPAGFKMLKIAIGLDLLALLTIRRLLKVNY